MDHQELFEQWRMLAQNDLDWAETGIEKGDWRFVVVQCQQAIEKLAKGIHLLLLDKEAPKIHKINEVVLLFADKLPEPVSAERQALFSKLSSFYLEGRYPDVNVDLKVLVTESEAKDIFTNSKEAFQWLLALKPSLTSTQVEQSKASPKP
jgi:HEPN domain-containing protein